VFVISFITTFIITRKIIPWLRRRGVVGKDLNKPGHPEVPEMGGVTIVIALEAICGGIAISVTYFGLGK